MTTKQVLPTWHVIAADVATDPIEGAIRTPMHLYLRAKTAQEAGDKAAELGWPDVRLVEGWDNEVGI